MQNILFFSPDLNLCTSLLMFFNDKYAVTTTTDFTSLNSIVKSTSFDLIIIDSEPDIKIENLCKQISDSPNPVPIILTYVYTSKLKQIEEKIKKYVTAIFYKPFDIFEVSKKIESILLHYSLK